MQIIMHEDFTYFIIIGCIIDRAHQAFFVTFYAELFHFHIYQLPSHMAYHGKPESGESKNVFT